MNTIAFEDGGAQEETVSAFLMLVLEYATEIGLFSLLERLLHVTMKTVRYSPLSKAQTIIASLVVGCARIPKRSTRRWGRKWRRPTTWASTASPTSRRSTVI